MATASQVPFPVLLGSLAASVAAFGDLTEGVIHSENAVVSAFPYFPFPQAVVTVKRRCCF